MIGVVSLFRAFGDKVLYWFAVITGLIESGFTHIRLVFGVARFMWVLQVTAFFILLKFGNRILGYVLDAILHFFAADQGAAAFVLQSKVNAVWPYLEMVNVFLPVNEITAMFVVYVHVWIGFVIYRIFKSWIPTVSG